MALIFVTTGTQLPFDRLLRAIDNWALVNPEHSITVQALAGGEYFSSISPVPFLSPKDYDYEVKNADVIIGHAGIGTIITGYENQTPVIIMPRRFSLNEHRNDHQMSTVQKFSNAQGIYIALNEKDLTDYLDNLTNLLPPSPSSAPSRDELISYIEDFITVR